MVWVKITKRSAEYCPKEIQIGTIIETDFLPNIATDFHPKIS